MALKEIVQLLIGICLVGGSIATMVFMPALQQGWVFVLVACMIMFFVGMRMVWDVFKKE